MLTTAGAGMLVASPQLVEAATKRWLIVVHAALESRRIAHQEQARLEEVRGGKGDHWPVTVESAIRAGFQLVVEAEGFVAAAEQGNAEACVPVRERCPTRLMTNMYKQL